MWRDHPFSQRNKATKTVVGMGIWESGLTKFKKGAGGGGGG